MCKRRYSGCFIYKQQNVAGTPLSHCNLTEFILPFSQTILPAVFWFCFLMSPCTSRVLLTHFVFFLLPCSVIVTYTLKRSLESLSFSPISESLSFWMPALFLSQAIAIQYSCLLPFFILFVPCSIYIHSIEMNISFSCLETLSIFPLPVM